MAVKIRFDNQNVPETPTFVLMRRNGKKIGKLPAKEIHFTSNFNSSEELSFKVYKEENGTRIPIWDEVRNFRLVWCKEWNLVFEIYVEISETNDCIKNVTATSICEAELSNIILYGIEINTEDDIATTDYIPTVIYRSEASKKRGSLLDRLLEKAPHYTISHVDSTIANIQRTFSFDGTSIYDAFQEVATEINCLFVFGSSLDSNGNILRTISVYDLESNCNNCGHREEFTGVCPECGSSNVKYGYGTDTTIFVTTDNLANEIGLTTDTGAVKNCFRLECGDDIMTDVVASINPNGSRYIWYISDETKEDMSSSLVSKLSSYDSEYAYYNNTRTTSIPSGLRTSYNNLVSKYRAYDSSIQTLPAQFVGFSPVVTAYFNAIDLRLYLSDVLMPSVEISATSASKEAAKLTTSALSPVAVTSLNSASEATVSSAVLAMAKSFVDPNYQVKVNSSSFSSNRWTGNFVVTNYSDDEDTATSSSITVTVTDNQETYLEQAIRKKIVEVENSTDIVVLFDMTLSAFTAEIKKYCLDRLVSFHDACQSCLDILLSQNVADSSLWSGAASNLYTTLYTPYYNKLIALESEIKTRESEIAIVAGVLDDKGKATKNGVETELLNIITAVQDHLNFEKWLGSDWEEFCSFRREDTYKNDNYVSNDLDNAERIENAKEFLETAQKEIFKSATLQHSISSSLKNLLVMKEFQPLVDYFEVGNWLRVRIDDKIYRLRLISYDIDFENLDDIGIEFSDVKQFVNGVSDVESILNQAKSMTSSYGSVMRQASQGEKSKGIVDGWTKQGLDMTKMRIVDQADNQSFMWDSHGLLCREYFPITDTYSPKQLKLINTGIYLTDDNWTTSKTAIGNFFYKHPETGQIIEAYGVNGETLIGSIILGEQLGIYNSSASLKFNQNGLAITNGTNTFTVNPNSSSKMLALSNKTQDLLWVDSSGQLHIRGDGGALDISANATFDNYETTKDAEGKYKSLDARITANAEGITLKVSSEDYNGTKIASLINQSASTVTIQASHIKLEGIVTANSGFKIDSNGSMTATGGTFSGSVTANTLSTGNRKNSSTGVAGTYIDTSGNVYVGAQNQTILHANGNAQIGGSNGINYASGQKHLLTIGGDNGIKYDYSTGKVTFGSNVVISWDVPSNVITTDNQSTAITNISATALKTGTISASLIAANSIEATKLKVSQLSTITGNIGKLYIDNYLTTNTSRTSYNQAVNGLTLDNNGIGGYYSSSQYWTLSKDGKITAISGEIGGFTISTNGFRRGNAVITDETITLGNNTFNVQMLVLNSLNSAAVEVVQKNGATTGLYCNGIESYNTKLYITGDYGIDLSGDVTAGYISASTIEASGTVSGYYVNSTDSISVGNEKHTTSRGVHIWCSGRQSSFWINKDKKTGIYLTKTNTTDLASNWLIALDGTGHTEMHYVYNNTSTTAANMVVASGGTVYRYSSSSKRYKHNIKPLTNCRDILNLPVVSFIYNENYLSEDDQRYGKEVPGFIAEDVEQYYPIATDYVDEKAEDWNMRFVIPPMLGVLQEHDTRIAELEAEVKQLKLQIATYQEMMSA